MRTNTDDLGSATRGQATGERGPSVAKVAAIPPQPTCAAVRETVPVLGCDPRDALANGDDVADAWSFAEALAKLHQRDPCGFDVESAAAKYLTEWADHEYTSPSAVGGEWMIVASAKDIREFAFEMRLLLNRLEGLGVRENTRARATGEAFLHFMHKVATLPPF